MWTNGLWDQILAPFTYFCGIQVGFQGPARALQGSKGANVKVDAV